MTILRVILLSRDGGLHLDVSIMESAPKQTARVRRPSWLKVRLPQGNSSAEVRRLLSDLRLHTVCQSARCPNVGECWGEGTATFLILGDVCTRRCTFCAVAKGAVQPVDPEEPERVAEAAFRLGLKHVVVTSVTRDDLPDGGASHFAQTIYAVKHQLPNVSVEVLIPDFKGSPEALQTVLAARPDVLNHNLETVPRLYPTVRIGASYERSIALIKQAARSGITPKSGLMLGLGESNQEILRVMNDLHDAGCQILTLGQYLQPTPQHHPVSQFITPYEFAALKEEGIALGFRHIESGPLARSSYMAHRALQA
jgi:lipoic acid synthetase